MLSSHNGADEQWRLEQEQAAEELAIKYLEHLDLHNQRLENQDSKQNYRQLFILAGGFERPERGLEFPARGIVEQAFVLVRRKLLPIANQEAEGVEPPMIPIEYLPDDDDGKINLRPVQDDDVMLAIEHLQNQRLMKMKRSNTNNVRTKTQYLERYRSTSAILGNASSSMNAPTITGDVPAIKHQIKIVRESVQAYETALADLHLEWQNYKQSEVNNGNFPPSVWPEQLLDRKHSAQAKLEFHGQELEVLQKRLEQAKKIKDAPHPHKGVCLPTDRSKWANCKLWNSQSEQPGVMKSIGGQEVRMKSDKNGNKILFIDDPRSRYDGMPVYRFKAEILRPMSHEYNIRVKREAQKALAEKRGPKQVSYPKPPLYNQETGTIEYPSGYDSRVLKKLKQS